MTEAFNLFQRKKDFLICIDSDGCAMDTMDVKHIRCFGPCMIQEWGLEEWRDRLLHRWNVLNLYTMTRGINRFKGLAVILKEIDQKYTAIEGLEPFCSWTENAKELSNENLKEAISSERDSVCMEKALRWSYTVNDCISHLPDEDKKPFPGVAEALEEAEKRADVVIVSSANRGAVEEEWARNGLLKYIDLILSQDAGSKQYCIGQMVRKGEYSRGNVLMVGDAPGDWRAASQNGVYFYPILVGAEKSSWREFREQALAHLYNGTYSSYGEYKEEQFLDNLKER
mgnify:CR=1 FL=1